MSSLFNPNWNPDSKFMRAMGYIADLLLLNLLYLITCVPIVTIGAANTALYTVCFRIGTDREKGVVGSYFRAFRDNFKQGTVLWLIALVWGIASGFNTYLFYNMSGAMQFAFIPFAVLFVLVLLIFAYAFPLLSQFSNNNKATLKNALLLSIAYLPRSVLIIAITVFPFVLLLLNFYLFLQAGLIWILLYFSAGAYINTILLKKVFAPYMPEAEEEKE